MGEIFTFLRTHKSPFVSHLRNNFGGPGKARQKIGDKWPYLWDEIESAKHTPCKLYLKSEIQEYITLHNPTPPKPTKRFKPRY